MDRNELPDANKRQTLRQFAAVGAIGPFLSASETEDGEGTNRRDTIAAYIDATPGAHFSKIRDDLGLGTGETQYHLRKLETASRVESDRDGDYRRYFAAGQFDQRDREILGQLRRSTPRKLVIALLTNPDRSAGEIATHVDRSPAAISQAAAQLEAASLLDREGGDYAIIDPERTIAFLVRYAQSFGPDALSFADNLEQYVAWRP